MRVHVGLLFFAITTLAACGDAPPDSPLDAGPTVEADARTDAMLPPDRAACDNGIKDGDETDVDCGGTCNTDCRSEQGCQADADCLTGMTCQSDPNDRDLRERPQTCKVRLPSCVGDPCGADSYCSLDWDDAQAVVYTCAPRRLGGQPCAPTPDKDVSTCAGALQCARDAFPSFGYHCVAGNRPAGTGLGGGCLNDEDCARGLHCDGFTARCEVRADENGACYNGGSGSAECATGLECVLPTGLTCEIWIDCGSQMDCCALHDGTAECRVFDSHTHCQPPQGSCAIETRTNG